MSHFNLKSLAFYGTAIGAVVVLFSVTTSYGESHVKAPLDIDGRYSIASQNLPDCLAGRSLMLDLKQSGTYLSAALVEATATEKVIKAVEQRPPLSGEWNTQQFSLAGSLLHIEGCQGKVTIAGTIQDKTMNGTLSLNAPSGQASFTAQKESPEKAETKSQGH
jgi:hypothetical protein